MPESNTDLSLWHFWAKTTHDPNQPQAYHPLLCHLLDVAAVAWLMWREVLPQAARRRLAGAFGLTEEEAGKLIAFIAGLHDLGKASPPFALRHTTQNVKCLYDGTPFANAPKREPHEAPHGYVTACELPEILRDDFGFPPRLAALVGVIIGGHHGVFPRSSDVMDMKFDERASGKPIWREARRHLTKELAQVCGLTGKLAFGGAPHLDNATAMLLAGLVSVADWIGSNSDYFPCRADTENPSALDAQGYWTDAKTQAEKALRELHWLGWPTPDAPRSFAALFPHLKQPRALQTACETLAQSLHTPGLVLIEAPMGEGKTEAAMYLADHWNATLKQRGCYFALPTQATSNQMFGRVKEFLDARFPGQVTLLQLLHGQAALNAEFEAMLKMPLTPIYDEDGNRRHSDDCTPQVVAAEWFTYRKRGLLAPFGVGTVDQALLAVLQTKHVFVRLFGLAHKTIIIDEVHAYDAYMSALLERLLEWLAALGSPVVLLSATLPRARRDALLQAYRRGLGVAPEVNFAPEKDCYPRLSWTTGAAAGANPIETSRQNTRTLHLRHCYEPATVTEPFPLGVELQKALADGGCAAVICNTVKRAQAMYQALQPYFSGLADDGQPELDLLHARFLFRNRNEREKRALLRFGKPGGTEMDSTGRRHPVRRPRRAVLVATQVIEQSLDLDFDLMVSDLAPVDLLLQRSGRLHRHRRENRPCGLSAPTLWILQPALNPDGTPNFGVSQWVYAPHILLRSWLALRNCEAVEIPGDIETLIEAVYDDACLCPDDAFAFSWRQTSDKMRQKLAVKEGKAKVARILSPHYEDLFEDFNPRLQEDSPDSHKTIQALTRDDELPSLSVVALLPDEWRRARGRIDMPSARFLLERSVSISHRAAVDMLLSEKPPSAWQDSPLLRHHRLLELDAKGQRQIGTHQFILDPSLGVIIRKQEE